MERTTDPFAWLMRYESGEQVEVWHEIAGLGARVREPRHVSHAQDVCDAFAHRARANLERLVESMTAQGYVFHDSVAGGTGGAPVSPLGGPGPDAPAFVAWLEATLGPVPMILSSWIRIVGDVWLVGGHPSLSAPGADPVLDPLVVELSYSRYEGVDPRDVVLGEHEEWQEACAEEDLEEPFVLSVAPDALHKAGFSGGAPYGVVLPDPGADAVLVVDGETESFVGYVRRALAAGGLPARYADGQAGFADLGESLAPL